MSVTHNVNKHLGVVRNDIYVTLEHGVFEKSRKSTEENVEVGIEVVDNRGRTIPVSAE